MKISKYNLYVIKTVKVFPKNLVLVVLNNYKKQISDHILYKIKSKSNDLEIEREKKLVARIEQMLTFMQGDTEETIAVGRTDSFHKGVTTARLTPSTWTADDILRVLLLKEEKVPYEMADIQIVDTKRLEKIERTTKEITLYKSHTGGLIYAESAVIYNENGEECEIPNARIEELKKSDVDYVERLVKNMNEGNYAYIYKCRDCGKYIGKPARFVEAYKEKGLILPKTCYRCKQKNSEVCNKEENNLPEKRHHYIGKKQ